jgi:hypothetical protein
MAHLQNVMNKTVYHCDANQRVVRIYQEIDAKLWVQYRSIVGGQPSTQFDNDTDVVYADATLQRVVNLPRKQDGVLFIVPFVIAVAQVALNVTTEDQRHDLVFPTQVLSSDGGVWCRSFGSLSNRNAIIEPTVVGENGHAVNIRIDRMTYVPECASCDWVGTPTRDIDNAEDQALGHGSVTE